MSHSDSTQIRELVRSLWADAVGADASGASEPNWETQQFLALGGNSLTGAILIAELLDQLEVELNIDLLLESAHVGDFENRVVAALHESVSA